MKPILWHSNAPWATTGYGVQTALFVPRLQKLGYRMAISAFWGLQGSRMEWDDMLVYPSDDQWGNRLLPAYAAHHGGGTSPADVLTITLLDVWVLNNFAQFQIMNMANWCPVDHEPLPPRVDQFFKLAKSRPIAISQFGRDQLQRAGFDPLYVPHGIDTKAFRPMDDRTGIRSSLGIPGDAFVVGMVAMNKGSSPSRKAFPQALEAFRDFQRSHSDAVLYLHMEKFGAHNGMNLYALVEGLGIPKDRIRWGPQLDMELGIPAEAMAALYSAMDVSMLPSYGEGFGIPIVESQACGTPVIVGGWTSMPELCGAGWTVEGDRWYNATQGAYWHCPRVGSIVECLEAAYDGAPKLRDKAVKFASGYDADIVTNLYWKKVLGELTTGESPKVLEVLR